METCGTEEPYEGKPHVRICGGAGWATTGSTRTGDAQKPPLVPRCGFRARLKPGVRLCDKWNLSLAGIMSHRVRLRSCLVDASRYHNVL